MKEEQRQFIEGANRIEKMALYYKDDMISSSDLRVEYALELLGAISKQAGLIPPQIYDMMEERLFTALNESEPAKPITKVTLPELLNITERMIMTRFSRLQDMG